MRDRPRNPDEIVTTRRALHDEVWEEPLVHVAKRYGVSGVWLGKLCDRRNIPRPPFGLWARSQRALASRPPLPPASHPDLETIRISAEWAARRERLARMLEDPRIARLLELDAAAGPFHVRKSLHGAHPLVRRGPLEGAKSRGSVAEDSVDVSKPHVRRALLLIDALLCGLADRGFDVRLASSSNGPKLTVAVLGVEFGLMVREVLRPTMRSAPHPGRWEYAGLQGQGELELHLWVHGGSGRRCWRESEKHSLEERFASVPRALIELAAAELENRTDGEQSRATRRRR